MRNFYPWEIFTYVRTYPRARTHTHTRTHAREGRGERAGARLFRVALKKSYFMF